MANTFNLDDKSKSTIAIKGNRFSYPMNVEDGSPFVYLAAYDFVTANNGSNYGKNRQYESTKREYSAEFCFYVPKTLKFSFNPQIQAIAATIDEKLRTGLATADPKLIARGIVQTGGNLLAMGAASTSIVGTAIQMFKQFQLTKGKAIDPKMLQLFSDSTYLNYQLNFKLIPESISEAFEINHMLTVLKILCTPQMSSYTLREILKASIAGGVEKLGEMYSDAEEGVVAGKIDSIIKTTNKPYIRKSDGVSLPGGQNFQDAMSIYRKAKADGNVKNLKEPKPEDFPVTTTEPNKTEPTNYYENAAKESAEKAADFNKKFDLTIKEMISESLNIRLDVLQSPLIFDMYLINPNSTDYDTQTLKVNSKEEMEMYSQAKGLLVSSLNITMLDSTSRDDIPFTKYGFPAAGWELDITLTSIAKHTR